MSIRCSTCMRISSATPSHFVASSTGRASPAREVAPGCAARARAGRMRRAPQAAGALLGCLVLLHRGVDDRGHLVVGFGRKVRHIGQAVHDRRRSRRCERRHIGSRHSGAVSEGVVVELGLERLLRRIVGRRYELDLLGILGIVELDGIPGCSSVGTAGGASSVEERLLLRQVRLFRRRHDQHGVRNLTRDRRLARLTSQPVGGLAAIVRRPSRIDLLLHRLRQRGNRVERVAVGCCAACVEGATGTPPRDAAPRPRNTCASVSTGTESVSNGMSSPCSERLRRISASASSRSSRAVGIRTTRERRARAARSHARGRT